MSHFGKLESELLTEEIEQCRNIVSEISRFGVNERQLLMIIRLLSLELENIDHCREIIETLGSFTDPTRVSDLVGPR